jgi:hypothetical protein
MAIFALVIAAALFGSDPDGVVTTAPDTAVDLNVTAQPLAPRVEGAVQDAVPHGLSTNQQIDRWIEGRSVADKPWAETAGAQLDAPGDDRKMHGEVSVGVGTGGYRDYGMAVSLPLGENGRLDISYRQVENGYGYGYGGYGYGRGFGYPGLGYDRIYAPAEGYGLYGD